MRKVKSIRLLLLGVIALALLLSACTSETPAGTPAPAPTATSPVTLDPTSPVEEMQEPAAAGLEEIIVTRAPRPIATPDWIAREVTELVESTRLEGTTFLGLTADNWINLAISLLIIVISYAIGAVLTRGWVSRWLERFTTPEFSQVLRKDIGPRLK